MIRPSCQDNRSNRITPTTNVVRFTNRNTTPNARNRRMVARSDTARDIS